MGFVLLTGFASDMAQFRLSVSIASRSAGRSVVAMTAYRAGCRLRDHRQGRVHDYARRRGVVYAGIVLPDNAPAWASDREQLWNRVEEREGRRDAQLGREVLLSLPHELGEEQRRELALTFARYLAAEYGLAVDVAIHTPSEQGDDRNHHAHLLVASRAFDMGHKSGWAKTKDRRLDAIAMRRAGAQNAVEGLRQVWEAMENAALTSADVRDESGELVQVDRRSYARQGLTIKPGLHDGPEATAFKRRTRRQSYPAKSHPGRSHVSKLHPVLVSLEGGVEAQMSGYQRNGALSRTRHSARAVIAFNQWLAEPMPSANLLIRAEEMQPAKRPNTDPCPRNLDPQASTSVAPPWRWQGLDTLNQELSEPVEDERKKERGSGGNRQLVSGSERLNTDPELEGRERPLPEPKSDFKAGLESRSSARR